MPFCSKCGGYMKEEDRFCQKCGANRHRNSDDQPKYGRPEQAYAPDQKTATPDIKNRVLTQVIFGIVNIFMGMIPFGILGIVFAALAQDAPDEETAKHRLSIAKTLNILGVALFALLITLAIALLVIGVVTSIGIFAFIPF